MLNQPTSSDMMVTMLGLFVGAFSWARAVAVGRGGPAKASRMPLFTPLEQVACGDSATATGLAESAALAERSSRGPLDAATYPKTAPAVIIKSAEIRLRFMTQGLPIQVAKAFGDGAYDFS